MTKRITENRLKRLKQQMLPLIWTRFTSLSLPVVALEAFEPSQIGTIVGALMDALIPHLPDIPQLGLLKHEGILAGNMDILPPMPLKSVAPTTEVRNRGDESLTRRQGTRALAQASFRLAAC